VGDDERSSSRQTPDSGRRARRQRRASGICDDTRSNLAAIIDTALVKAECCWLMQRRRTMGRTIAMRFGTPLPNWAVKDAQSISTSPSCSKASAAIRAEPGRWIHPNAEGAKIIGNLLYPKLRDIVDQISNSIR
jgi:hypothetical protein